MESTDDHFPSGHFRSGHFQSGHFRYSRPQRLFHWTIAALLFLTWPLGLALGALKGDTKTLGYLVHESLGFLVLWLMLCRVGVRVWAPPAPAESGLLPVVARCVHLALYAALIVMPITGFLTTNAFGFPLHWFGILPVWSPIGKDEALGGYLKTVHIVTGWTILGLTALHVGAAVFHALVLKDGRLRRMM